MYHRHLTKGDKPFHELTLGPENTSVLSHLTLSRPPNTSPKPLHPSPPRRAGYIFDMKNPLYVPHRVPDEPRNHHTSGPAASGPGRRDGNVSDRRGCVIFSNIQLRLDDNMYIFFQVTSSICHRCPRIRTTIDFTVPYPNAVQPLCY